MEVKVNQRIKLTIKPHKGYNNLDLRKLSSFINSKRKLISYIPFPQDRNSCESFHGL